MFGKSKLLGIDDVRRILKVSKQYIHRLAEAGKIPYEETSSGKIFLLEDILKLQKGREQKSKVDKRVKFKK